MCYNKGTKRNKKGVNKMAKTIVLNGIHFEVHKSKAISTTFLQEYAGRTIYDCYSKPSYSKECIYKMWEEWAYLNDVEYFGVSGYNGFQFTLQGLVKHDGHTYILHITKTTQKAYIVD